MKEPDSYTTPQVAEIVGMPTRKVLSYVEQGLISPSVQDASGHGSKRLWNYTDVVRCFVLFTLQTFGFKVAALRNINKIGDDDFGHDRLWCFNGSTLRELQINTLEPTVFVQEAMPPTIMDRTLADLFHGTSPAAVLVIAMEEVQRRVDKRIQKL